MLLAILVFNWVGYRILTTYMEAEAIAKLESQLDSELYDENELIEMSVSLDLPYQTSWKDFERVDGEVEIGGILYKYVKRKLVEGQMIFLCLPDKGRMQVQTARDDFFRLVNDLQHPSGGADGTSAKTPVFKNISTEYLQDFNSWTFAPVDHNRQAYAMSPDELLLSGYPSAQDQPPDDC